MGGYGYSKIERRLGADSVMAGKRKLRLYGQDGEPSSGFNQLVLNWLRDEVEVHEHRQPKAFDFMRKACDLEIENLRSAGRATGTWSANKDLLSNLTTLMFGDDISGRLTGALSSENINPAGFRSQLSQSVAKNTGENFLYALAYCLADCLKDQDEILVDKGMPSVLKPYLTMHRIVPLPGEGGGVRRIAIPIESDLAIWSRSNPSTAIVVNAKTRLKEVFHIGTMWKLLYDMLGDDYCLSKWGLEGPIERPDMSYVFATADMVRPTGTKSQGPDVERDSVRNLIAMDASFFDYTFVSKSGIDHVARDLNIDGPKESLFHELGCILDLIEQRFPTACIDTE